jgi:ubiquinone biosynthesis protein UbiJ
MTVAKAIPTFFAELGQRGHEPLLEKISGTLRFDLRSRQTVGHWLVTIVRGEIAIAEQEGSADCVVQIDRALFERVATGAENAVAALLRGEIGVEGDIELLMLFDRLFPGPPGAQRLAAPKSGRSR